MGRARGPHFLAVHDKPVATLLRTRLELRCIRSRCRLGYTERLKSQFPPRNLGQEFLLLLLTAMPEHCAHRIHLRVACARSAPTAMDRFKNDSAASDRQPPAAIFLRNEGRQISRIRKRLNKLGRVTGFRRPPFQIAPVLIGKLLAKLPHADAQFRVVVTGIKRNRIYAHLVFHKRDSEKGR